MGWHDGWRSRGLWRTRRRRSSGRAGAETESRFGRPSNHARRPAGHRSPTEQRSPTRLKATKPKLTPHASTPGPYRLPRAPVPAVDPLLHPLPVAGVHKWSPRKPGKSESLRSEIVGCKRAKLRCKMVGCSPRTSSRRPIRSSAKATPV